jgi:hypothetical protein
MTAMGCDIHMHVEVRDGRKWRTLATPRVTRNYSLFALMARCGRTNLNPIVENRGIPLDAGVDVAWRWNKVRKTGDYHSPSWLLPEEVAEVAERFKAEDGRDFWLYFDDFDSKSLRNQEWRLVFWFDN